MRVESVKGEGWCMWGGVGERVRGEYEGVEGGQGGGAVWGGAVRCGGNLRVSERLDEARRGWVTARVKTS